VRRVGEQREGVGDEPHDELERHESNNQTERDAELASVRVRGNAVRVAGVTVVVLVAHWSLDTVLVSAILE
jgi:hypothetical protein